MVWATWLCAVLQNSPHNLGYYKGLVYNLTENEIQDFPTAFVFIPSITVWTSISKTLLLRFWNLIHERAWSKAHVSASTGSIHPWCNEEFALTHWLHSFVIHKPMPMQFWSASMLHFRYPGWGGGVTSLAFSHSPRCWNARLTDVVGGVVMLFQIFSFWRHQMVQRMRANRSAAVMALWQGI